MNLTTKYNLPVPRYTSYPTVPYWNSTPSQEQWKDLVKDTFKASNSENGISVYMHLPFCESLCTYCACNTRITVNHKVEEPYLQSVLKEWQLYLALFDEKPKIKEIHLGGGTPTFFSPENLNKLMGGFLETVEVCAEHDFSFEGHPANTSKAHLQTLFDLGFRRVSFGIQDFDPLVQDVINRYQTFEQVEFVTSEARKIGYNSVNFDLVYGLPHQHLNTITDTISKVISLRPDRIAFYSYAHVPWLRPGQRKYSEKDLPVDVEKRKLYEKGLEMFSGAGYRDVGMDHFALENDPLYQAMVKKKLHRNFMGYTDKHTRLMISLGASAIGDTWTGFAQNIKVVEPYQKAVAEGKFPIMKGHILSEEDQVIRQHILEIMCAGETYWNGNQHKFSTLRKGMERCMELEADGLVKLSDEKLTVTETGKAFLRNICYCFDQYAWAQASGKQIFSTAV